MLISIFVLSIGLLGVVALIPVGARAISETAKANRASACARAATREVVVRGMLDRTQWYYANGNRAFDTPTGTPYAIDAPLLGQTLVIDPLQIAAGLESNLLPANLGQFPYPATTACPAPLWRLQIWDPRLQWLMSQGLCTPAMLESHYRRIFTWPDDQLFEMPEARDQRPRQFFTMEDGSFGSELVAAHPPAVRQSDGNYSWLITAVPSADDTPSGKVVGGVLQPDTTALKTDHQRSYVVSVAVFYKRALDLAAAQPPERWVGAHALSGLLGPMISDVELFIPSSRTTDYRAEYLDVKRNQWILLVLRKSDDRLTTGYRTIARWYRVVAADDPAEQSMGGSSHWTRRLTLAGPDWDRVNTQTYAILLDGVIDVHTTTVEVGE